jgi:hypothetical protein
LLEAANKTNVVFLPIFLKCAAKLANNIAENVWIMYFCHAEKLFQKNILKASSYEKEQQTF